MLKHDIALKTPIMNAAGILGFAPNPRGQVEIDFLGAFVTNPISLNRRTPARGPRFLEYPGGLLLHTGLPNPGLASVVKKYGKKWGRSSSPVIPHIIGETPQIISQMVAIIEDQEGVMALELGLPPKISAEEVEAFVHSAQGELPLIVRLNLEQTDLYADLVIQAGGNAISLGPPRGTLPDPSGRLISGRLYGPALFAQGLAVVQNLASKGIPVIGSGGIYSSEQARWMLAAGALAVQLDTVLWRSPWSIDLTAIAP